MSNFPYATGLGSLMNAGQLNQYQLQEMADKYRYDEQLRTAQLMHRLANLAPSPDPIPAVPAVPEPNPVLLLLGEDE